MSRTKGKRGKAFWEGPPGLDTRTFETQEQGLPAVPLLFPLDFHDFDEGEDLPKDTPLRLPGLRADGTEMQTSAPSPASSAPLTPKQRQLGFQLAYEAGIGFLLEKKYEEAYQAFSEALTHKPGETCAAVNVQRLEALGYGKTR